MIALPHHQNYLNFKPSIQQLQKNPKPKQLLIIAKPVLEMQTKYDEQFFFNLVLHKL